MPTAGNEAPAGYRHAMRWAQIASAGALWAALAAPAGASGVSGALPPEPDVLPPELEPTRPEQNLESGPRIQSSPRRGTPLLRQQQPPQHAEAITFVFRTLTIEGATALKPHALRLLWSVAPGEMASVAELFDFANAITRAYAQAGYALSFAVVPEQTIEDGAVTVRVIEGFVDEIAFVGERAERLRGRAVLRRARQVAARIRRSRPLKTADLERYLLLINDLPGFAVAATLEASAGRAGGAVLNLEVTAHNPLSAGLSTNNYMPASLDRQVAGLEAGYFGGLSGADEWRVSAWRSLTSDAYWSVTGTASSALGAEGLRVGVSALHSRSDPETAFLEALEFLGETTSARAFASYPLIRARTQNLSLSSALSLTDVDSELLDVPLVRDRVRALEVALAYDFAEASRAVTYVRAGYERGLDVFGATGSSRANGQLDYNLVTLDAQRRQPLFAAFSGEVSAQLALRGQAAFGPQGLFSPVECAFGGRRFGRGYDAGIATGDHCALGYGELAWRGRLAAADTTVYAFGDVGYLWQKGSLQAGERRRRSAASAGVGLRIGLANHVDGVVETSWAVRRPQGAVSIDNFRVNAGLRLRF